MKTAKEILLETVDKDCVWEEMNNLTNVPISEVVEAMEVYKNKYLDGVIAFELGRCKLYDRDVFICTRKQLGGAKKWVCMLEFTQGWCIGKDGHWHFEKTPSSRTDEFIEQTRFNTYEDAREAYYKHLKRGIKYRLLM